MQFQEYSLNQNVLLGLESLNFQSPTPIQKATISTILEGQDLIGCAETGSGKTGAFCIPMFSMMYGNPNSKLLILTPTRELGQQVADFCRELVQHDRDMKVSTIVGGVDMKKQKKSLKNNPRIVVGTPGRINDHLKRGTLKLNDAQYLVLDEGDRMLDMGFAPQLEEIFKYLPNQRQTILFTATMAPGVKALANRYLNKPKFVQIGETSKPVEKIDQQVIVADDARKQDVILDELNARQGSVIVFTKTKQRTSQLFKHLRDYGYAVDLIHGGRTQGQRNTALKNFRVGKARILCATDVAARGLDIPQVEHVINYDLPVMKEDYVHRVGRTARNGASGEALSLVANNEKRKWMAIVKKYNIPGVELVIEDKLKSKRRSESNRRSKGKSQGAASFDKKPRTSVFGADSAFGGKPKKKKSVSWSDEGQSFSKENKKWDDGDRNFRSDKPKKSFGVQFDDRKPRRDNDEGFSGRAGGKKSFSKDKTWGSDDRSFGGKRSSERKKPFAKKSFGESKSWSNEDRDFDGRRSEGKKTYGKKSFGDSKSWSRDDRDSDGRRSEGKKPFGKKSFAKKTGSRRDDDRDFSGDSRGEGRSYGKKSAGGRKPFGSKTKSWGSDSRDSRSDGESGLRRSGKKTSSRKDSRRDEEQSFGGSRGGKKKAFGKKISRSKTGSKKSEGSKFSFFGSSGSNKKQRSRHAEW